MGSNMNVSIKGTGGRGRRPPFGGQPCTVGCDQKRSRLYFRAGEVKPRQTAAGSFPAAAKQLLPRLTSPLPPWRPGKVLIARRLHKGNLPWRLPPNWRELRCAGGLRRQPALLVRGVQMAA